MAWLAVHDKKAEDNRFTAFFDDILLEAADERNYVKKAVSWALRNIGKRNKALNIKAVEVAKRLGTVNDSSSKWIARDVLKELTSDRILGRLEKKK